MPRRPGEKFGRKASVGPDAVDIASIGVELVILCGVKPKWEVEAVEPTVLLVRCVVEGVVMGPVVLDFVDARRCSADRDNILHIMLQTAHRCYNEIDRMMARAYE